MRYCVLPETRLSVSRIALGTDMFGTMVPAADAYRLLDTYAAVGGTVIDTAHVYADWLSDEKHMSEKTIGKWLRQTGNRNNMIVTTKGAHPPLEDMHHSRLSRTELEQDVDESLSCLGVDAIDLYWLHRDDPHVPAGEIMESLHDLEKAGKIRYYAASNWLPERIEEANRYAREHGWQGFAASQIKWSLAVSNPEAISDDTLVEMDGAQFAWYRDNQFPVFAFSPQAKGFFSKLREKDGSIFRPSGKAGARYENRENIAIWKKLCQLQQQTGVNITQLVLGWLLQQPFLTIPIVGCKTTEQIQESLAAADLPELQEFQTIRNFNMEVAL